MKPFKKLSILLNGCYSFYHIDDEKSDQIPIVTSSFIEISEGRIYKQPKLALRNIKIELLDVHQHYQRLSNELRGYYSQLNTIVAKGPWLESDDLKKVDELGRMAETLNEFVYQIEDSMGNIVRILFEHFSLKEIGEDFADQFIDYLGPFDWVGKAIKNRKKEIDINLNLEIISKANELIMNNEVEHALDLLLKNVQSERIKKNLILLKHRWSKNEKEKLLMITSKENLDLCSNKIVHDIQSLLK